MPYLTTRFKSQSARWSILIFSLAFTVRIVNLLFLSRNDPAFYYPQVDSLWHHLWALDILKNNFWGTEVYFRGPLYPYFLALVYSVFDASIFAAKLIQAAGGALICVLIYRIGAHTFEEKIGRLAGLFAILYGPMIFYESELLIEWLAILLALAMIFMLVRFSKEMSISSAAWAGVFCGLSAIARPNILVLAPLFVVWMLLRNRTETQLSRRLSAAGIFALGVFLCVLPVTIRNYIVADDIVLISSQGGVNFYLGNNSEADGLTMVMPEINLNLSIPWSEFVDTTSGFAQSAVGRALKSSEVSDFWNDKAIDYISSHPLAFLILTCRRVVYLFSGFENSDQADIYRFRPNSPILAATIFNYGVKFPFGIIAPLSLIGLVLAWSQRRRTACLYLFLLGYIPTVVLFLVTARHRLAVIAVLLIFAAVAVMRLSECVRTHDYQRLVVLFAALVCLVAVLNHNWFSLGYDNPAQFHYQRALVLEKQGKLAAAISEYNEALRYQPLAEVFNNLGFALSRKGDFAGAYRAYQQAMRSRPDYAAAMTNLGQLFLNSGSLDSAEYYLTMASASDPRLPQVYQNLSDLEQRRGNLTAAESILKKGIEMSPRSPALYNALANHYLRQNREPDAKILLEQAIAIDEQYAIAHVNLANILLNNRDFVAARGHYRKSIVINPDLKQAHFNLALLFLQTNLLDSARQSLEAVLRIDPGDRQAQEALRNLTH